METEPISRGGRGCCHAGPGGGGGGLGFEQ